MVKTITITKHLSSQTKHLKVLLCYDFKNGITNEKENLIFETARGLFSIILITYQLSSNQEQ
jgi:hypothetical protein